MRASMHRQLSRWVEWWGHEDFASALGAKAARISRVSKLARELVQEFHDEWGS